MAFGFVSGGLFLLCAVACALPGSKNALQQSSRLPQAPTVVECKAQSLVVSVDIPPSGSAPRFEAIDATGAYPVTERYGAQCGYTYSVQPLLGHVDLRASYFSCHTGNQNDEVFTFMFGVFTIDESGKESSFNVSKTCSVPPFSPRVVTCEENYMEVSVRTDLPCPTAGSIKDFSASLALAQSSAVEAWQVMLQKEGQQPEVMSVEYAATLGYIIMVTPGRLVFRTTFGQLYASVKMVNGAAVEVIQATVFFRQNWMVVMVDLVATCSLVKGSSDDSRLHWRTPAERTPPAVGPSKLRTEYMGMGVSGGVANEWAMTDQGYSVTVGKGSVAHRLPSVAEGGIRKNQQGVVTKPKVVRQMATPPVPRPPLSVNQSPSGTWRSPAERTPLAVGTSELWGENRRMGASGGVVDKWAASDRGYSVTVGKETVAHRFPSVAEGGIRKNQQGVVIKPNVVRQIANPPVPRPPLSVNQSPSGTWRSPAERTPLAVGTSELRGENMGMGVSGGVVDERATIDRGYSITVGKATVGSSILSPAEGGIRKDQHGVVTKPNVVKQMASPPIPLPFSVNQTNLEERVFHVYLGNIPSDVELVSVELNGQEISVLTAAQMGYSISRVSEGNATSAYIIRVPFEDQFVAKQYVSAGLFEYSLEIKWTLNIRPQMEAYYHLSSVSALVVEALPPVFDSMCTESGISFEKDHQQYDYLWDIAIGSYTLTPQLASERGYILTNDSTTLILAVPLFTIGYVYEDITLQQFYGTFKLLTRNAKTLEIEQSSAKRCLFQTTELLVCSTEGVMTIVTDITKAVPSADPARTTLLDQSCRPQETDDTRVLFSFGLNTCGTRFQIDQQYVTYENELVFHELYSTDSRPVITRDAAYRVTMRCIYPVRDTESLFVDRKFRAETPGIGQIKDPVKVPPQMLKPMQLPKQAIMKPSFQGSVARKPTEYVRVGQWSVPQDKYAQRSLGA
ncbi:zona pellucida protein AX 4 isoform X13 [Carassius gibelio]|uniref:zona pellucida protein AX 4 isoform X13 n=1 Tax=Carassius gibelio TaxID=101364 RepID=UPI002278A568|nr:zona pellucida protein AX 4 isoform X13 [Carassius gibelio]